MIRTIPREYEEKCVIDTTMLSTVLVDETKFAFDTGSGEGISVHRKDFVYLDESEEAKRSVLINGPSCGAPTCLGRGPLVFRIELNGKKMGLLHPNGILAEVPQGGAILRLVSAIKMKRNGIRYITGKYNEPDYVECLGSGVLIPTESQGNILTIKTSGFANEILDSVEFR